MNFLGRAQEKKVMHQVLGCVGVQVLLIYGRRRVGKSELIKQVLRESKIKGIYYESKQTTEMNNVASLSNLISEFYNYPKLSFDNFEAVLDFLFQKAVNDPFIFVLDEYPYLRAAIPGLDSILQTLIDKYRDNSSLKLILCGSFIDVMKSLLLSENPLYGRVDRTIDLKPMDYYESSLFYPGYSNEDKIRLYSVFGGIPYYNKLIDSSLSVRENIIALIASSDARLENEVSMYLRSEISKISNANEVFEALSRGYSRYSDILSQSHVTSAPAMVDVLGKLMRMGLVRKESPINDENNKKKTGYYISDNLSLFYYRYCFRYASQLSIMDSDVFYNKYIRDDFENWYVPHCFEAICKQYLIRQNKRGLLPEVFEKIGKYYYNDPKTKTNGEFDVVTFDPKGYTFYEVKFRKTPVTDRLIRDEIRQVNETGLYCYQYGFISRSGFEAKPQSNLLF
ncbi:MAG: ATP-binding protein, partial [Proteobacteria bacterium]|nr:ATP-binding protein [Pseudomonadota bacterium]